MNVLDQVVTPDYAIYHGDSTEILRGIPDNSIHYSIYSPPFSNMYCYSDSPRDLGNSADYEQFFVQYRMIVAELYRVLMPGRLLSVHCMLIPTLKQREGYIGLLDFRGDIIRAHQDAGFIFHSEVCIWKDPVIAMQRTKALGLLWKQLRKDSAMSRQGIPDYLCTFRKPGDNDEPIAHSGDEYPVELWQRMASPVWLDIDPSDTLQRESARGAADEKHIAPLQLEVVRRALDIWTNEGDTVLSPFAGLGSEVHEAIVKRRRAVGVELKESYYKQACLNCQRAVAERSQATLFDLAAVAP